jgi:hypothetical protein
MRFLSCFKPVLLAWIKTLCLVGKADGGHGDVRTLNCYISIPVHFVAHVPSSKLKTAFGVSVAIT